MSPRLEPAAPHTFLKHSSFLPNHPSASILCLATIMLNMLLMTLRLTWCKQQQHHTSHSQLTPTCQCWIVQPSCRSSHDLQALGDLLNQGRSAQPSDVQAEAGDVMPANATVTSRTIASRRGSAVMPATTVKPAVSRRGSLAATAAGDPELDPEVSVTTKHSCLSRTRYCDCQHGWIAG